MAWAGAGLVAVETLVAAVGVGLPALSLTVLMAPGLAFAALLPERARSSPTATLAAVPALGVAATSVAVITVASVGVTLDGTTVRIVLGVLALAGLLVPARAPAAWPFREELPALVGLPVAVVLGTILHQRVITGDPVPGNDWAKYILYADEIRAQGSLLIDNPFWMLGVPFREDPGVPALYGAYLKLTDQPASVVVHGIVVLAAVQIASLFALVRTLWGQAPGITAALLWAVLPINATILGWHGLANVAALALLPLLLLYAAVLLQGELDVRAGVGAAVVLIGLAAAHRLSLGLGLATLIVTALVALAFGRRRQLASRGLLAAIVATAALSAGVVYDLLERNSTFGGTLGYRSYLSTKLSWDLLIRDLTVPFSVVGAVAAGVALWRVRKDPRLIPLLCLLGVTFLLAYAYVVHLPLHYTRMAYYLPLALVPMIAVALWLIKRPRWLPAILAVALAAYLTTFSFAQNDNVSRFYSFANPASIKGLDAVAASIRPGEVVVTDRCWGFLATWLLHTRTLAALDTADIQPKAELPYARRAHAVLAGRRRGRALARRMGVRYVLVDPTCTNSRGRRLPAPPRGEPVFVSARLVVMRLGR